MAAYNFSIAANVSNDSAVNNPDPSMSLPIWFHTMKIVLNVTGILGNLTVVVIYLRKKDFRPSECFILCMALIDFCFSLISLFLFFIRLTFIELPTVNSTLYTFVTYYSLYLIFWMSFNRYIAVVKPIEYMQIFTSKTVFSIIGSGFAFGVFYAVIAVCYFLSDNEDLQRVLDAFYYISKAIYILIDIAFMCIVYTNVTYLEKGSSVNKGKPSNTDQMAQSTTDPPKTSFRMRALMACRNSRSLQECLSVLFQHASSNSTPPQSMALNLKRARDEDDDCADIAEVDVHISPVCASKEKVKLRVFNIRSSSSSVAAEINDVSAAVYESLPTSQLPACQVENNSKSSAITATNGAHSSRCDQPNFRKKSEEFTPPQTSPLKSVTLGEAKKVSMFQSKARREKMELALDADAAIKNCNVNKNDNNGGNRRATETTSKTPLSSSQKSRAIRQRRVTLTLFFVSVVFIVVTLPYSIVELVEKLPPVFHCEKPFEIPLEVKMVTYLCYCINFVVNPIVYMFGNSFYRTELILLCKKMVCC